MCAIFGLKLATLEGRALSRCWRFGLYVAYGSYVLFQGWRLLRVTLWAGGGMWSVVSHSTRAVSCMYDSQLG